MKPTVPPEARAPSLACASLRPAALHSGGVFSSQPVALLYESPPCVGFSKPLRRRMVVSWWRVLLVFPLGFLAGCPEFQRGMTAKEIGEAVAECRKYGLQAEAYRKLGGSIIEIQCAPDYARSKRPVRT